MIQKYYIINHLLRSGILKLVVFILLVQVTQAIAIPEFPVNPKTPAIVPLPQSVQWYNEAIPIDHVQIIIPPINSEPLKRKQITEELNEILSNNKVGIGGKMKLELRIDKVDVPGHWNGQKDEAYCLVVGKQGVLITANAVKGLYYGVQTLRQLMVHKDGMTTLAACKIHDYPAFKVRGFMHDVGRNFQSLVQLKMQIDIMAAYKMNVFHWHLTDHFGWRLESKIYPALQKADSFGRHIGKFYTQDHFKEMVDYCWARGITIIPEFDSPGHSGAFRRGLGIKNMKDPLAIEAICALIDEVCTLADKKQMPYIHIGTDEVRHTEEYVDNSYLPTLHESVHENDREVIGWWKGMKIKGDIKQIQQTWAQAQPVTGLRHIDSRANYVNHLEALDFVTRILFQQPCRVPNGDDINLGGVLACWPDNRVDNEQLILTNNPVIPSIVAYSEAVWKGIEENKPEYWAKLPEKDTPEFLKYVDFENRIAEQRSRFLGHAPFPMVKTNQIEWRLLGPVTDGEIVELEAGVVKDFYESAKSIYKWTEPVYGAAIHIKHFFGFEGHLKNIEESKEVVWANTYIHSEKDQELDAWIGFNTTSSSDNRAGVAQIGHWNANIKCNLWINDKRVAPPTWKNPGKMGKEIAFTNEIYSSRPPTKIKLKKGWNKVLIKSAPSWKWVFSFSPINWDGKTYSEVEGLRFSTTKAVEY